jgi:hypothetical protein
VSGPLFRTLILSLTLLSSITGLARPHKAEEDDSSEQRFQARIPLGIEGFFLRPERRMLYVMTTADSPSFDGWRLIEHGSDKALLDRDGSPVHYFPQQVHFRVTATTMLELLDIDTTLLDVDGSLNDFLRGLSFRLKVFHGLQLVTLAPDSIDIVGVPTDVSSEERVFRANFTLPPTPIGDRMMLEVLTPKGERLCKFHLEF